MKKGITKEQAFKAVSELVSDNKEVQAEWLKSQSSLYADFWKRQENGPHALDEVKYIGVSCFSPIYLVDYEFTRLSPHKEYVRSIIPLYDLECLPDAMLTFADSGYIILKPTETEKFEELPYRTGYIIKGVEPHYFGNSLILPLPEGASFFVEIEGQTFYSRKPSPYQHCEVTVQRAGGCWQECEKFRDFLLGKDFGVICDNCYIRSIIDRYSSPVCTDEK